jgi:hypothetical protein
MTTEATKRGASADSQQEPAVRTIEDTPRFSEIDSMAERFEQNRNDERDGVLATDSDQASMHAAIDEARGTTTVEPDADTPESEAAPGVDDDAATAPVMENYIVEHNGQQMFKTLVDGQEVLVPLDRARAQLQKHEAAEVRLQIAANRSRNLDEREEQIRVNEAALHNRSANIHEDLPSNPDVGDQEDLRNGAREVISSMFSDTEEEAADKLVNFITDKISGSPQTPVETGTLVDAAADRAVEKIDERDTAKDAVSGYEQFQKDYPDIMADQNLFLVADTMTDEIAREHPDWVQSQVMAEAGKRTREWAGGNKPSEDLTVENDLNDRQDRKDDLVPMPSAAASAQSADIRPTEVEGAQSPKDALNEIKQSRGQMT